MSTFTVVLGFNMIDFFLHADRRTIGLAWTGQWPVSLPYIIFYWPQAFGPLVMSDPKCASHNGYMGLFFNESAY